MPGWLCLTAVLLGHVLEPSVPVVALDEVKGDELAAQLFNFEQAQNGEKPGID
jgi:hypothetical protein